jgi:hypothetical protein
MQRYMLRRTKPESDVERSAGEDTGQEYLDFGDPRWIIDDHRHNLIKRFSKPKRSWLGVRRHYEPKRSARNTEVRHHQNNGSHETEDGQNRQNAGDNPRLRGQLEESHYTYRIDFCELQRMHLRQLQHKLVQHVVNLRYNAAEPSGWADDLRKYGEPSID